MPAMIAILIFAANLTCPDNLTEWVDELPEFSCANVPDEKLNPVSGAPKCGSSSAYVRCPVSDICSPQSKSEIC